MSRKSKLRLTASCAAALLISHSAYATDYTWNTAVSGNWNDPTKWTPNTAFPVSGDTATFNTTGVNGPESIAMTAAQAATSVTFANTGTTAVTNTAGQTLTLGGGVGGGITVNSGAGVVTLGSAINNAFLNLGGVDETFLNNNGAIVVTINGQITNAGNANPVTLFLDGTGTGGVQNQSVVSSTAGITDGTGGGAVSIVKNGTGTWQLNNNGSSNVFTGNITINQGILKINGSNTLGLTSKTLTLSGNSATLAAVGSTRTVNSVINTAIGGNVTFGVSSGGASLNIAGTVDLTGGIRAITCNGNTTTLQGIVSNGGITKKGSSTLQLGNTGNTYSSATTILTGTLAVSGNNCMSPNSPVLLETGSTLAFNNGSTETIPSLSDGGVTPGTVTLGNLSTCAMVTGSDNTNTSFSGVIAGNGNGNNAPPVNVGGITKVGSGAFTLSGLNTYNANTIISGGVLSVNTLSNGGLSPSITTNITGGTANTAVVSSTTGLVIGMTVGNGNNIPLGTTITAINTGTNTITMSANATVASSTEASIIGFANSLGLAANTASYLVLDGGTLRYTGAAVTTDRLFTMTTNGGTIDASGASNAALNLAGNGANLIAFTGSGARTLTLAGTSTGANTLAPILGDNGGPTSLMKTGTGAWTLGGANTYTGPTTVNGGVLMITQTMRKSSDLIVADSAKAVMTARTSPGAKVLEVGTLNLNSTGTLDLNDNDLVVTTGSFATLQGLVFQGYRGSPDTTATGIVSTTSQTVHGGTTILALFDNSLAGFSDWPQGSGNTIAGTAIVGKYTYIGDTNMDGQVTPQDYTATDANLNTSVDPAISWFYGDTNFDGNIDASDYTGIDAALNLGVGSPLAAAGVPAVPEPGLALLGAAGLLAARTRRSRAAAGDGSTG